MVLFTHTIGPEYLYNAPHTRGPWHLAESENEHVYKGKRHLCILPDPTVTHGLVVADIETLPEAEANARRIVGAVNACEGIPTEALESGVIKQLADVIEE